MGLREMNLLLLALLAFPFLHGSPRAARAQTEQYDLTIQTTTFAPNNKTVTCNPLSLLTVNGQTPGPEIRVRGNQNVLVRVTNQGPYGITIHWHGVKQPRNPWADGPEYITQCPILPGQSFTYNISLSDEVGTIWWHAHSDWSRLTVHGAFVILPPGDDNAIVSPDGLVVTGDHTLIFGSWYDIDVEKLHEQSMTIIKNGTVLEQPSDRYTINGLPGDQFSACDEPQDEGLIESLYKITVERNGTYLLRLVNAAMLEGQYFGITGHTLTVIARDGALVEPFTVPYIVIFPGETMDVKFTADNSNPATYYMAFNGYSAFGSLTTGLVTYSGSTEVNTAFPPFPGSNNNVSIATDFINKLKSPNNREDIVPTKDADVLRYTMLAARQQDVPCTESYFCDGTGNTSFTYLNRIAFLPNTTDTILGAHYHKRQGVYDPTFPQDTLSTFIRTPNKVMNVTYNESVEIVFQMPEDGPPFHPMHLHGYSFFLVGMGDGTFNSSNDVGNYNLTHPPEVNTATVFRNGWTAVRFYATNPGVWFMHCHIETHVSEGMATAMIVHNGGGISESMIEPPGGQWPACAH